MARAPPSHLTSIHSCMKLSLCDGEALRILCGQINIMEPERKQVIKCPLLCLRSNEQKKTNRRLRCKCGFMSKDS